MTASIVDEITRLSVMTQPEMAGSAAVKKKWPRPVIVGLAAVMLAGGTATAAATTEVWAQWTKAPDATFTYTLPSGIACEVAAGDVQGTDPDVVRAAEDFYKNTDIEALLTDKAINAAIANQRAQETTVTNADGSTEPGGFGTTHYREDAEYDTAVNQLIQTALSDELSRQGIDGADSNLSSMGETQCPGVDW